jgi:hypothetical protein
MIKGLMGTGSVMISGGDNVDAVEQAKTKLKIITELVS